MTFPLPDVEFTLQATDGEASLAITGDLEQDLDLEIGLDAQPGFTASGAGLLVYRDNAGDTLVIATTEDSDPEPDGDGLGENVSLIVIGEEGAEISFADSEQRCDVVIESLDPPFTSLEGSITCTDLAVDDGSLTISLTGEFSARE